MSLKIESEEQAWDILRKALDGALDLEDAVILDFANWPNLDVYLPETPISGSISPTMMAAFIEFQKSINRSYALITSDTGDLRTLSKIERDNLEIRVKITEGSSGYVADLAKPLESIGIEAIGKMESTHLVITILGLALIAGGTIAFTAWLKSRTQQRKDELEDAEKQRWLEAQQAALHAGTDHMNILARAMKTQPLLVDIDATVDEARAHLLKSVAEEGGGRMYQTNVDRDFASEVSCQKRRQGEQIRMVGNYRLAKIDATLTDGFRVTLIDEKSGLEFAAMLQDALVSEKHQEVIDHAKWNRTSFYAEIKARKLGTRVVDAVIVDAAETPAKQA